MFYVIQIGSDLLANEMSEGLNWPKAVDLVLKIISKKGVDDINRTIRTSIEKTGWYVDKDKQWSVCIRADDNSIVLRRLVRTPPHYHYNLS